MSSVRSVLALCLLSPSLFVSLSFCPVFFGALTCITGFYAMERFDFSIHARVSSSPPEKDLLLS